MGYNCAVNTNSSDNNIISSVWLILPSSMDVFKEFMRSSSIHGLSHIVSTTRYSRLFWIIVVIVGFSVSSVLINQSFISWSESPVSTTIETLPISKIEFPKGAIQLENHKLPLINEDPSPLTYGSFCLK